MLILSACYLDRIPESKGSSLEEYSMTYSNKKIPDRRREIAQLAATQALDLPLLPSGFWFHHDLRDNFYYAIHLFAYCADKEFKCNWSDDTCENAKQLALAMISRVLSLQVRDYNDPMYGHWPLNLGSNPSEAKPNPLTVELMGCLLILFYDKYQSELPPEASKDCYLAIKRIYRSCNNCQPSKLMVHHTAKQASLKLLLGYLLKNHKLQRQGLQLAKRQFDHIGKYGFREYGSLPWYWHWIQAFTCVWEVVDNAAVHKLMSDMLDLLWRIRADYYLQGTWVGAHSRQSPHDGPQDQNTLLDYIQFGDFPLPKKIVRLEGSALLTYEVSENIVKVATNRMEPVEIKQKIQLERWDSIVKEEVHTYVYIDRAFAVGGIWERINEFDNEQQRWKITFPLTQKNENSVNQAFFFHPGAKYIPGDDRHASPLGEVMYHKNTVMQMWHVPVGDYFQTMIGCLPSGEWKFEKSGGYGQIGDTYVAFQLMNEIRVEEKKDRISVSSPIVNNWNGVIMEVVSSREAMNQGIHDFESFIAAMMEKNPSSFKKMGFIPEIVEKVIVSYHTFENDGMEFSLDNLGNVERYLNHKKYTFHGYQMNRFGSISMI